MDDVSLRVRPGEVVGLLGPNGAGKTTTLRMLAGILSPDRGRVRVDGLDIHAEPIAAKRGIGFLSGDTQLYQRLTPREVLRLLRPALRARPGARSPRAVAALIAELDMAAFADRPCGTLSSGQKQRANIARAFLHDPPLLILDEPTNALDVVSGQFIVAGHPPGPRRRPRGAASRRTSWARPSTCATGSSSSTRAGSSMPGRCADLLVRSGQANLTDAFLHYAGADAGAPDGLTMRLSIVRTILVKELRETLRDRRTLLLTVGLPVLLYPLAILAFTRIAESGEDAIEAGRSAVAVWGTLPAPVERRSRRADGLTLHALGRGAGRRARRPDRPAGCRGSTPTGEDARRAGPRRRPRTRPARRSSPRTRCSPRPATAVASRAGARP